MKKFGELSKEEKMKLFEAWVDGNQIETLSGNNAKWISMVHPVWCGQDTYRIAPTKPSINWDHVHPDYEWLAEDKDGRAWLYPQEPSCGSRGWFVRAEYALALSHSSYKPGTCHWEESLIKRPSK